MPRIRDACSWVDMVAALGLHGNTSRQVSPSDTRGAAVATCSTARPYPGCISRNVFGRRVNRLSSAPELLTREDDDGAGESYWL